MIVLPACVTVPSAELSSEAAFMLLCLNAAVKRHSYTTAPDVPSVPPNENRVLVACWVPFYRSFSIINVLSSIQASSSLHFNPNGSINMEYLKELLLKIIKRSLSFINKQLFTRTQSTVLDKYKQVTCGWSKTGRKTRKNDNISSKMRKLSTERWKFHFSKDSHTQP